MNDDWTEVPGFSGYFVNSDGQIRGKSGKILKPQLIHSKSNHLQVRACTDDGKWKNLRVHRAVLIAFVGECPEGLEACHINGDETNNILSNLRWGTHQSNLEDKRAHGTLSLGESHYAHRLTEDDVIMIRSSSLSQKALAELLGVNKVTVGDVVRRTTWKHI